MSPLKNMLPLCLAILCVTGLAGQQKGSAPDSNLILQREQQRVKYLVSGDVDALARMTSPTLSYSHSNGSIDGPEKYLNDLRIRHVVFRSLNHREVAVRFLAPQVAMLNGLSDVEVKVGEQDLKMTVRFTIVYVQRNGEWLFEAWQASRLP